MINEAQLLFYDGTYDSGGEILIDKDWEIEEKLNNRSVMKCIVSDTKGNTLEVGKECYFYDYSYNLLWAGVITKIRDFEYTQDVLHYDLRLEDFSALANRIVARIAYENRNIDYIVKDLLSRYLANSMDSDYDLSVTEGTIETGLTELNIVTFNYLSISACLNKLCEFGNYTWNIDKNKQLNFHSIGYVASSTVFNRSFTEFINMERVRDLSNYRNYQVVKGNKAIENMRVNEIPMPDPDGIVKSYNTKYPIAETPLIQVSTDGGTTWLNKTVGVLGFDSDSDFEFFWTYNSDSFSQSDDDSALGNTHKIRISYKPLIPIMVISKNPSQISNMGLYENFNENLLLENKLDALTYANQLIVEYAQVADKIKFSTYSHSWNIMEQITMTDSLRNIANETFLIESIVWKPVINHKKIIYEYKVLDGAAIGGWEEFFKKLIYPEKITLKDNELIITLYEYDESRTHSGDYDITIYTDLLEPSTTLYPSNTLYPNNSANSTDSVSD